MLLSDREPVSGPAGDGAEITIRRQVVRRRILAAAKHRFAAFGVENVTLADVAAEAGMDWDDLQLYFRDKDRLLTAILDEGWRGLLPSIGEISLTAISAHSALVTLFAFMTNALHKDEDLARLLLFEGRRPNPELGEIRLSNGYRQFLQICRDLVLRGQRDGSFRSSYHPQVAASMLVGALEGMLRDRLIAEQERTITSYSSTYLISTFDALVSSLKV